ARRYSTGPVLYPSPNSQRIHNGVSYIVAPNAPNSALPIANFTLPIDAQVETPSSCMSMSNVKMAMGNALSPTVSFLPSQAGGLDDELQVWRGPARNVIEAFDEILRASLFFRKVRDDDEVLPPQVFGERMSRVVLPGQLRQRIAFHLEQFPKLFA